MTQMLKQSTQVKVVIGPVVAIADGITPVTTLSLATADEAELMKHDAAAVVDMSGATMAAITGMDGYYNLTLTTSHTDTLGMVTLGINDDSLCLPVKATFMITPANVWDSLYSTDKLQVDLTQITGVAEWITTAIPNAAFGGTGGLATVDASNYVAGIQGSTVNTLDEIAGATFVTATHALDQVSSVAAVADAVLDELYTEHTTPSSVGVALAAVATVPTASTIADAVLDELHTDHTTVNSVGSALADRYWCKWRFNGGTTEDRYEGIEWFKNTTPITSGITLPKLAVTTARTGLELIAESALTEVGSLHIFYYDATGVAMTEADKTYEVTFTATIDGAVRTFSDIFEGGA